MPDARTRFLAALVAVFLALVALECGWLHATEALSNRVTDAFLRSRAEKLQADPNVVIVAIDEASITAMADLAGRWPWPRSVHGELVAGIAAQKPKAIVFDVMFGEPDVFRPESDEAFNEAIREFPFVYFPTARHDPKGDAFGIPLTEIASALGAFRTPRADPDAKIDVLLPLALSPENWRLGLINFLQDRDGVGRRYGVFLEAYGWKIPSLPARLAADLGWDFPDREDVLLDWRGGIRAHPTVSFAELYVEFNSENRKRPSDEFRDKIVVIGATATGLHDIKVTPVSNLHPGVEILATAIDNLHNRTWLLEGPRWLDPALAASLILVLSIAVWRHTDTVRTAIGLVVVTLLLLVASWIMLGRGVRVPVMTPVLFGWAFFLVAAIGQYVDERRSREIAVREFSRFVNPHVVRELIAKGGLSRQGESREVTLLFSDIRGFTTLSESRTPGEVVNLLNRYFSRQVDVVFRHGGTLDKFIGDCIMACWGAPVDDPDHARHAVAAALDMADTLQAFKRELAGDFDGDFDVGIGIHSGPAVVGLIGSDARREYTAIGDTVNLASRIEGLTKGVARILVSEETMRRCGDAFDFIDRGAYKIKGRAQDARLYEPRRKSSP
ncbi:MAG: adenylate/guanylate cyclase domain-containing protein [Burkholderiales bacterium]|nr:adenylate/guanylate cyclase domain-containing protein [Burkholderiales bacterium]